MKLEAKARLLAKDTPSIENKKKQIENIKRGMPSSQNRRSMNPTDRLNNRKRVLNLQTQIVDERLRDKAKEARK
jgi:hypothetical protein